MWLFSFKECHEEKYRLKTQNRVSDGTAYDVIYMKNSPWNVIA